MICTFHLYDFAYCKFGRPWQVWPIRWRQRLCYTATIWELYGHYTEGLDLPGHPPSGGERQPADTCICICKYIRIYANIHRCINTYRCACTNQVPWPTWSPYCHMRTYSHVTLDQGASQCQGRVVARHYLYRSIRQLYSDYTETIRKAYICLALPDALPAKARKASKS